MYALKAHIKFSIFRNIFSRIEKVVITFSIPKKIFQKWKLMCALRAHIKFSIFRNIFLGIEKVVITFSILEKIFSKNGN